MQLRYFAMVADTENMTESARRLNVSQSALSAAVSQLERELGLQLFIRSRHRGLVLSAAGAQFYREIRVFLEHADQLYDSARGMAESLTGDLRVGVYSPLASFRAPEILNTFEDRHPRVHVTFTEGDLEYLRDELIAGRCELALMYDIGLDEGFDSSVIVETPPHVVVAAGHRLAQEGRQSVSLTELADEPLILLDLPYARDYVLGLFEAQDVTPYIRHRVNGYETVRSFVASGIGYAVMNQRLPGGWTYAGQEVAAIPIEGPTRPIRVTVARPTGVIPTRRSAAFEKVCHDVLGAH
ncbi:LysR family transcriptional regulator [Sinomonas sp. B1-1]|uniref:LysR family transcriptional regulator n=1 Tax=Sinomonas sp. B1-1 TaxID=3141454 RepID=UPI003D27A8CE